MYVSLGCNRNGTHIAKKTNPRRLFGKITSHRSRKATARNVPRNTIDNEADSGNVDVFSLHPPLSDEEGIVPSAHFPHSKPVRFGTH